VQDVRVLTDGLEFPEGPVALPDGDVLVTELKAGRITRVKPDGTKSVVAEVGGSANGLAIGPDGKGYVCNSGGFAFQDVGFLVPQGVHHETQPPDYIGGRIQRIDLETGAVEDLYTECDGNRLTGPNDIVFDEAGGFWFTDHGKMRPRDADRGGLYYALPDGSSIKEVVFPLDAPNGVGLSPDGRKLYVAETHTGRVWQWDLSGPGEIVGGAGFGPGGGTLLAGLPGYQLLDSLAVDAEGNVVVATIISGGWSVISPEGEVKLVALPPELFDPLPTNICFGGPDLRTAYLTSSATRRLLTCTWETPGTPLWWLNQRP
jgi:gluconolactonase